MSDSFKAQHNEKQTTASIQLPQSMLKLVNIPLTKVEKKPS
ncbi:MAG: hypothetical protein ACRCZB_04125 [Bacteroidales bacterium]